MMRWIALLLLAASIASAPAVAEDATPHDMLLSNGEADTDKCALCHEEDMSLSRSKLETCTLCHSTTVHSGANEHLHADPARVAQFLASPQEGAPQLPLAEDGHMYCGTCHVFHDPRVNQDEKILDQPWVPSSPLALAVRESLAGRLATAAPAHDEGQPATRFSDGTRRLRMPIADGSLCRRCHRFGK